MKTYPSLITIIVSLASVTAAGEQVSPHARQVATDMARTMFKSNISGRPAVTLGRPRVAKALASWAKSEGSMVAFPVLLGGKKSSAMAVIWANGNSARMNGIAQEAKVGSKGRRLQKNDAAGLIIRTSPTNKFVKAKNLRVTFEVVDGGERIIGLEPVWTLGAVRPEGYGLEKMATTVELMTPKGPQQLRKTFVRSPFMVADPNATDGSSIAAYE